MPVELHVIRASEFVCLDADEQLDFAASKQALETLARACRKRGLDRAVLDLRALPVPAEPVFTPSQLAALIKTFRAAGFGRHQRLAVLYRNDPHGGARMFAFIGRIQGWQVRAFADFEKALFWLSEETTRREKSGEEIPIRIVKRKNESRRLTVTSKDGDSDGKTSRPVRRKTKKQP